MGVGWRVKRSTVLPAQRPGETAPAGRWLVVARMLSYVGVRSIGCRDYVAVIDVLRVDYQAGCRTA
jgi:hypothetical protein